VFCEILTALEILILVFWLKHPEDGGSSVTPETLNFLPDVITTTKTAMNRVDNTVIRFLQGTDIRIVIFTTIIANSVDAFSSGF
jgi:hypothetical protein